VTDDEFVATFEMMETLKELDISIIDNEETDMTHYDIDGESLEVPEGFYMVDYEAFFRNDIVFSYTPDNMYLPLSSGDFSHMQENIGVMSMPSVPGAQGEQSSVHGSFPSGYVFRANVTEEEKQMIYQFIETLLSEELMFEHHVQYYTLPSIRVEIDTFNDELFQKIIHTTNEADGVFQGIREFIPPAIYDQFHYESEISKELNRFISGDQSIQEMVEAMQNYHEEVLQEANLIE